MGSGSFKAPGERLRLARIMRGYTLEDVARRADVSVATVSAVELGTRNMSPVVARRVARALGSSLRALVVEGVLVPNVNGEGD